MNRFEAYASQAEIINLSLSSRRERGSYQAHGTTNFSIAGLNSLHFSSGGSHCSGLFEVSQSGDPGADELVVGIVAIFRNVDALNEVLVCRSNSAQGEYGIGIYTGDRQPESPDKAVQFSVHLRLPAPDGPADAPIRIPRLSTSMPFFSHHLHELAGSVFFKQVALTTSNASIRIESITGDNVSLFNTNGEVRGTLLVSERLSVETSNGPIYLNADLVNDVSGQSTLMSLQTTNGPIEANVFLTSTASGGSFAVSADTTNAPIRATFRDGPVISLLNAALKTSNGPMYVLMNSMFQGHFELQGFPFLRPTVSTAAGRHVTITNDERGVVRGEVRLQHVPVVSQNTGALQVRTTNAPLQVSF